MKPVKVRNHGEVVHVHIADGEWARSEFPHPLLIADFDTHRQLVAVEFVGRSAREVAALVGDAPTIDLTVLADELEALRADLAGGDDRDQALAWGLAELLTELRAVLAAEARLADEVEKTVARLREASSLPVVAAEPETVAAPDVERPA